MRFALALALLGLACDHAEVVPKRPPAEQVKQLFAGCTRHDADRWIELSCGPLRITATSDSTKTRAQMEAFLGGYADGMKKDGAEWLDVSGPLRAVRTYYGKDEARTVTLASAWKPDGKKFADLTCTAPATQEERCRALTGFVGTFGVPDELAR